MKPRSGIALGLALGLATFSGCTDPPGIIPVAPPGMELARVPPPSAGSGSEAIGERPADNARAGGTRPLSTLVSEPTKPGETKKTNSGLVYETLKEGNGPSVQPGQTVTVNYVGRLPDGTKFDASADHGGTFDTRIGVGQVIKGWDEGIAGMKVGEKRRLSVPADLGYGSRGSPPAIPPNSPLVFEVDLIAIK